MSCNANLSKNILYKLAGETRTYGMEFSPWLGTGETILSTPGPSGVSDPDDLIITNVLPSGTQVVMDIAGGTYLTYKVQVTINTSAGQILIGQGTLKISDV